SPTLYGRRLALSQCSSFFFLRSVHLRHLHSFPTRRSSDLHLVLYHLCTHSLPDDVFALLQLADAANVDAARGIELQRPAARRRLDRKSTRLNSSHVKISYAVFCLKKKNK